MCQSAGGWNIKSEQKESTPVPVELVKTLILLK